MAPKVRSSLETGPDAQERLFGGTMPTDFDTLRTDSQILQIYQSILPPLIKKNGDYQCRCPLSGHIDKNPSFCLHQYNGEWKWRCWSHPGGEANGSIFDLVMQLKGVSFSEAVELVRDYLGVTRETTQRVVEKDIINKVFQPVIKKDFTTYSLESYQRAINDLQSSPETINFLASRGITKETAKLLKLGFTKSCKFVGEKDLDIKDQGWILFPYLQNNKVVCLKYRSIVRKVFYRGPNMETTLFNIPAINQIEPLYLTSGEFDACILTQAGFNTVSLPSDSFNLTAEMIDLLMGSLKIILAGDTDGSGSKAMDKIWQTVNRTTKLVWPASMKDANQTFLEHCKGDIAQFKNLVDQLTKTASIMKVQDVVAIADFMQQASSVPMSNDPSRMQFPWDTVDEMANLMPGGVLSITSTSTKQGKTVWVMNVTVHEWKRGQKILNYQCELSYDMFSNMLASHILRKDRNAIQGSDIQSAGNVAVQYPGQYWVGYDPTRTTVEPVLDLLEHAIKRLKPDIVVLDHLHFLTVNAADEIQAQAAAMQRIKNLAREYKIKFIVVAQPRKAQQNARGKAIHVSDFKGSEAITSSADAIIALHRNWIKEKDPSNPAMDDFDPITEVNLLGARLKGKGSTFAKLMYDGKTATFEKYAEQATF